MIAGTTLVLIQVGSGKSQSRRLLASVSGSWSKDGLLVEWDRRSVEETRSHLWIRELWHFRWGLLVVGPEGGGERGDRVSQRRELHFFDGNLGGVIPHVRREERIFVLRSAGLIH